MWMWRNCKLTVLALCMALLSVANRPVLARPPAPGTVSVEAPLNDRQRILHFLNRAGYGARPGEVEQIQKIGLFMYIQQQLSPETLDDRPLSGRLRGYRSLGVAPRQFPFRYPDPQTVKKLTTDKKSPIMPYYGDSNALLNEMMEQRVVRAVYTRRHLQEVVVDFWMNHFNVYYNKGLEKWLLLPYERDVIRPRALGRFRDLLGAVAHSPAMMVYLDNWLSRAEIPASKKNPKKSGGLNENYARELLELHTLGVDGGYTQHDVVEVARCFTGWTVNKQGDVMTFLYRPEWHDNGPKVVLGQSIPANGGQKDGERVLDILCAHPSTARFLARKMCRAFISDNPPSAVVDRVAQTFTRTDGDIRRMLATLFNSAEFWSPTAYRAKIKTPLQLAASALRAVDADVQNAQAVTGQLRQMGMGLYLCDPPTGYIDRADKWVSPGSLLDRLNFCVALVRGQVNGVKVNVRSMLSEAHSGPPNVAVPFETPTGRPPASPSITATGTPMAGVPGMDPNIRTFFDHTVLFGELTEATRRNLMAAVTGGKPDYVQVVGLLLGSPEFQRR